MIKSDEKDETLLILLQQAYEAIRTGILKGKFPLGTRLTRRQLAAELGTFCRFLKLCSVSKGRFQRQAAQTQHKVCQPVIEDERNYKGFNLFEDADQQLFEVLFDAIRASKSRPQLKQLVILPELASQAASA